MAEHCLVLSIPTPSNPPRGKRKASPSLPERSDRRPLQRVETSRQDNRLVVIAPNNSHDGPAHKPRAKQHIKARSFGDMRGLWIDTRRRMENTPSTTSSQDSAKQRARSSPATPSLHLRAIHMDSAVQMPPPRSSRSKPWPPWSSARSHVANTRAQAPATPSPAAMPANATPSLPGFSALCQSLESSMPPMPSAFHLKPTRRTGDMTIAAIPVTSLAAYRTTGYVRATCSKSLDTGKDLRQLAHPMQQTTGVEMAARPRAATYDGARGVTPVRGRPRTLVAMGTRTAAMAFASKRLGLQHIATTQVQWSPAAPAPRAVPVAKRTMCLSKELRSRTKTTTRQPFRISQKHARLRQVVDQSGRAKHAAQQMVQQSSHPATPTTAVAQSQARKQARPPPLVVSPRPSIRLSGQSRPATTRHRQKAPKFRPQGPATPCLPEYVFDLEMLALGHRAQMLAESRVTADVPPSAKGIAISRMHQAAPIRISRDRPTPAPSALRKKPSAFPDVPVRSSRLRRAAQEFMDEASTPSSSSSSSSASDAGDIDSSDTERGHADAVTSSPRPRLLTPQSSGMSNGLKRKASSDGGLAGHSKRERLDFQVLETRSSTRFTRRLSLSP